MWLVVYSNLSHWFFFNFFFSFLCFCSAFVSFSSCAVSYCAELNRWLFGVDICWYIILSLLDLLVKCFSISVWSEQNISHAQLSWTPSRLHSGMSECHIISLFKNMFINLCNYNKIFTHSVIFQILLFVFNKYCMCSKYFNSRVCLQSFHTCIFALLQFDNEKSLYKATVDLRVRQNGVDRLLNLYFR